MKKIIAAAVATAFVAPAFAADVTLSGDVEFRFHTYENDGAASTIGDKDWNITASEEIDGMTVTGGVDCENASSVSCAGFVTLSGGFGKIEVGDDTGHAISAVDEVAVVAEAGGNGSTPTFTTSDNVKIRYTLPTIVDGLTVIASYGAAAGTNDTSSGNETQNSSFAVKYAMNGVSVAYGSMSGDDIAHKVTYSTVSYTTGPFFVAYEVTGNDSETADNDVSGLGFTYNYGPGKLFFENETTDTGSATTDNTAYGISYKMGAVNTYVEFQDGDTATHNGTVMGIEYSF